MVLKVCGVLQFILIQVISAELSNRDLTSQNVLNYVANMPLAGYDRPTRQINNPPAGLPGNQELPVNGIANALPLKTGMPFGNLPHGNGLPNNFGLNDGLPSSLAFNNGLPNNSPFPNMNIVPQNRLLPSFNGANNNGLPFNNLPKGLPSFNNGLPGGIPNLINNMPNGLPSGLPSLINVPNGLPSPINVPNGLPGLNNVPSGLPSFTNGLPNGLPSSNNVPNVLPSSINVPNVLPTPINVPGFNNLPSGLPNFNNNPGFANKIINLNNLPAGINILNLNNLPAANSLPNMNNLPITNGLPHFNNLPSSNALQSLPLKNGLPLNNLPTGNILPTTKNQLPFLNNFRITEIGIGNAAVDINRFPRENQPVGNTSPTVSNVNGLTQQVFDELSNYQNNKGFSFITNASPACTLPTMVSIDNRFSSDSRVPINNGMSNIANEAQSINSMQLNNPEVSSFQNYNIMPATEQTFLNNVPLNNDFTIGNNFPVNTNSRLVNVINNGIPLSNRGYLNDMIMPETYQQNSDASGLSSNEFRIENIQLPDNNWLYDFVGSKMPLNQHLLPEGIQMFSDLPSDYQSVLTSNNLNLAQELVKNLQIEGMANMPFLNGLPVAGITETVTVLNGLYRK